MIEIFHPRECHTINRDDSPSTSWSKGGRGEINMYHNSAVDGLVVCGITAEVAKTKCDDAIRNCKPLSSLLKTANGRRLKAFVYPAVVTPRDIIRKSYDIVRSQDKADIIVIPNKAPVDTMYRNSFFICDCTYNDKPYTIMASVSHYLGGATETDAQLQEMVKANESAFKAKLQICLTDHRPSLVINNIVYKHYPASECLNLRVKDSFVIDFLNDIVDVKNKCILREETLPVDAPTKLDAEKLYTLWHCNDKVIYAQTILSSNWQDYPFTMRCFKRASIRTRYKDFFDNPKLKYVFNELDRKHSIRNEVSPEDYSLYQDLIFRLLGINSDRAFVSEERWDELDRNFDLESIRHCYAVAKRNLSAPMTEEKLME